MPPDAIIRSHSSTYLNNRKTLHFLFAYVKHMDMLKIVGIDDKSEQCLDTVGLTQFFDYISLLKD